MPLAVELVATALYFFGYSTLDGAKSREISTEKLGRVNGDSLIRGQEGLQPKVKTADFTRAGFVFDLNLLNH
jgi:hypothetical protein